jgi:hypothetical protein
MAHGLVRSVDFGATNHLRVTHALLFYFKQMLPRTKLRLVVAWVSIVTLVQVTHSTADAGAGQHAKHWSQRVQEFNVGITRKTCPRGDALKVGELNETPKGPCAPTEASIAKELFHNAARHLHRLHEVFEKTQQSPFRQRSPKEWSTKHGPASGWTGLTFFLLEEGPFNSSEIVSCFGRAVGLPQGVDHQDEWDNHVLPDVAEHLTDLAALRAFRIHPARVYSLADADVKVVGQVGALSLAASDLEGSPCGDKDDHELRMGKLARALLAMPEYQATGGVDFVTASTYFRPSKTLGKPLRDALLNPSLTGDLDFQTHTSLVENAVVIPYTPHYLLERSAAGVVDAPTRTLPAPVTHMFHGNMRRNDAGSFRQILPHMAKLWPLSDVENSNFRKWKEEHIGKQKRKLEELRDRSMERNKQTVDATGPNDSILALPTLALEFDLSRTSKATALSHLRSKMCLVPAGDTATSRRLFDALAAGCVPVFFAHQRDIIANLPFPNVIDWASIAIFAGSLECIAAKWCVSKSAVTGDELDPCAEEQGMACWNNRACMFDDASRSGIHWTKISLTDNRTADWLEAIASSADGNAALECMSMRGRETFRTYLSYRTGGFVTGLLHELEARFVWPRRNYTQLPSSYFQEGLQIGDWHRGAW